MQTNHRKKKRKKNFLFQSVFPSIGQVENPLFLLLNFLSLLSSSCTSSPSLYIKVEEEEKEEPSPLHLLSICILGKSETTSLVATTEAKYKKKKKVPLSWQLIEVKNKV